jgi:hypothetical protein
MSDRMSNSLMTMAHKEGVGEKSEQLMMSTSMAEALVLVFCSTWRTQSVITIYS